MSTSRRASVAAFSLCFLCLAFAILSVPGADAGDGLAARVRGPAKAALIELGRRLFFDPVVSRTGARSCASCHDPEHGFSDPSRVSEDDIGVTFRHSQTLIDSALNPSAHWDGEFPSIEALVTARIGLPQSKGRGYGNTSLQDLSPGHATLPSQPAEEEDGKYKKSADAHGDASGKDADQKRSDEPRAPAQDGDGPDGEGAPRSAGDKARSKREAKTAERRRLMEAAAKRSRQNLAVARLPRAQDVLEGSGRYAAGFLAVWGNRTVTRQRIAQAVAAYCRSVKSTESPFDRYLAGDARALSASALRGKALFEGRAGCAQCHLTKARKGQKPTLSDYAFHNTGIAWLSEHRPGTSDAPEERISEFTDPGRQRISTAPRHRRAFKTPTLRDLTRRGPYMHTGMFKTLDAVVRHYARGGSIDPKQDIRLKGFEIRDAEVKDIVAFLESLTGEARPGLADEHCRQRPSGTRLRFVDANRKPLRGLAVTLIPAGDRLPNEGVRASGSLRLVTDEMGRIEYRPPGHTHYRMLLPDELVPDGGAMVPDICRSAEVSVPVRGRTRIVARFDTASDAPDVLVAEHADTPVFEGHPVPRTRFGRRSGVQTGDSFVAIYEGWLRTDVPGRVRLRVPGDRKRGTAHILDLDAGTEARLDLRR